MVAGFARGGVTGIFLRATSAGGGITFTLGSDTGSTGSAGASRVSILGSADRDNALTTSGAAALLADATDFAVLRCFFCFLLSCRRFFLMWSVTSANVRSWVNGRLSVLVATGRSGAASDAGTNGGVSYCSGGA